MDAHHIRVRTRRCLQTTNQPLNHKQHHHDENQIPPNCTFLVKHKALYRPSIDSLLYQAICKIQDHPAWCVPCYQSVYFPAWYRDACIPIDVLVLLPKSIQHSRTVLLVPWMVEKIVALIGLVDHHLGHIPWQDIGSFRPETMRIIQVAILRFRWIVLDVLPLEMIDPFDWLALLCWMSSWRRSGCFVCFWQWLLFQMRPLQRSFHVALGNLWAIVLSCWFHDRRAYLRTTVNRGYVASFMLYTYIIQWICSWILADLNVDWLHYYTVILMHQLMHLYVSIAWKLFVLSGNEESSCSSEYCILTCLCVEETRGRKIEAYTLWKGVIE